MPTSSHSHRTDTLGYNIRSKEKAAIPATTSDYGLQTTDIRGNLGLVVTPGGEARRA
jgi:hypothetical protein